MKIVFLKKRWLLILFAVLIIFAIFYMTYMLHSVPLHESEEPYAVDLEVARLKQKLIQLENKAVLNQHNLEKIDQLYRKLSNHKNEAIDQLNQIQIPNKVDDSIIIQKKTSTTTTESSSTVTSSSSSTFVEKLNNNNTNFMSTCDWVHDEKIPTDIQMPDIFDKLPFDDIDGGVWKQGFDIKYDKNQWNENKKLKIIVVPHSHNDPGWLMTFEQYFQERTKYILDTVVNSLSQSINRKFIWSEISYLSLWWAQASDEMKNKMKNLILNTKQLEIVTGGWVMTDEANSNYYAMIEQMIEGHEWLRANIDKSIQPVNGWSIDPFGYSPTMAYLLNKMGFHNMVIQRVHYHIKKYLAQSLRFEFYWKQAWTTKNSKDTSIFCHVMPFYSYDIPHTCGPDPKICCQFDFKRMNGRLSCPWGISPQVITDNNVQERADMLLDQYRKKAQLYGDKNNHNVLLVQLGDDFRYTDMEEAVAQFDNYQRLMDYMNSNKDLNVEIKFGTLSDYFKLLHDDIMHTEKKVETFSGDFFTYADRQNHYWSGYFTSRPFTKRLDRLVESYVRSAEIAFSLTNLIQTSSAYKFKYSNELYKKLLQARRSLGLFQHHDGITGTSKTPVVKDYASKLYNSIENCIEIIEKTAGYLLNKNGVNELTFKLDDIALLSSREDRTKPRTEINFENDSDEYKVTLYNSNLNKRHELVSFKVNTPYVEVIKISDGSVIKNFEISLIWPNMDGQSLWSRNEDLRIRNIDKLKHGLDFDSQKFELLFQVELKPLSFETFLIRKKSQSNPNLTRVEFLQKSKDQTIETEIKENIKKRLKTSISNIETLDLIQFNVSSENEIDLIRININEKFSAYFSSKTGLLNQFENIKTNSYIKSKLSIIKYGTTSASEKSGAYLFLPDGKATLLHQDFSQWIRIERGLLRTRVCVNMTILLHCVEFYPTINEKLDLKHPHFSVWNVIDLRNSHNTEIALHIDTDIKNDDTLYTDLNGFQFIKRKTLAKIPLQGNVYPMPTASYIQDSSKRFNLLTAQPLGVASLEQSALQVFLDRRLDQDDNRGMEQAMNDNILTSSRFVMFFESVSDNKQLMDHPSIMLNLFSYDLLNPIIKLIASKSQSADSILPIRLFSKPSSQCGLRLLNLRTMQSSNEEPLPEVGLILHRVVQDDCQQSNQVENLCNSNDNKNFSFEDLFQYSENKAQISIENTYLTFSNKNDKIQIQQKESIAKHVQPMQIEAFRVKILN